MSKLSDLIQQAKQGKRISEMLPMNRVQLAAAAYSAPDDALSTGLQSLETLLDQVPSLDAAVCRILSHELDDIAEILR